VTQTPSPDKPRVGITVGDPAGVGPEIVLKSVADPDVRRVCRPLVIADPPALRTQADALGLSCDYQVVTDSTPASDYPEGVAILDVGLPTEPVEPGVVSAAAGRAAVAFIEAGVTLCLDGRLDAIATAPINKQSLRLAGSPFPGHTEMLASLCGADQPLMCFFAGDLRVVLLTTHTSLIEAIKAITKDSIVAALILTERELRRFGIDKPRIAVAGLNPHAGEGGLFGSEETREIEPAVRDARDNWHLAASGPFPADTLFVRAARGEFDAVLACHHDQGLIAVKCLAFGESVNVTLGLPIIRTSVDHGTAFDIAGRGVADHGSMVKAIKLAAQLVGAQNKSRSGAQTSAQSMAATREARPNPEAHNLEVR